MGATFTGMWQALRNKKIKTTICITIKFSIMNKKLFLGMFAAAGMLFATSCSNDELDVVQSGNEAQVTFSLGLEGGIATRAISDGKSADILYYAIYNADKKLITTINGFTNGLLTKENAFPNGSKQDVVEVTLAKGQEYTAVFWAQDASCDAYTVTAETDGLKVAVDYDGDNNDETRDAFFKAETFTVTGNTEIPVVLKRPFAQINVGVTEADWKAAVESGIEITKSKVVIKNAANSINLLDGTVSGEEEVTYDFSTIPAKFTDAETLEVDVNRDGTIQNDEKFVYLSMSYILTDNGADRTTLEADGLQFTFSPATGEDIVFDEGLHAVPVQRNWRTNILGKILTGDIQFNIEIDQRFIDDYNILNPDDDDDSNIKYVANAQELQSALDAATDGAVIYFANDITGDVIATQKPDVKVIILGQGYKLNGMITVDGKSGTYTTAGLTIKDLNFAAESISGDACIRLGNGTDGTRYTCNVTVSNCTFDVANAVGVKSYTGGDKNLTITGCTATANTHSLVQAKGIDGILVENCYVYSKNGLNFNNSTNVVVDNCTAEVKGYAARFGESSGGAGSAEVYTIKNSSLKSANDDGDAVVILRGSADYSTLNIENTTLTGTPQITQSATGSIVIIDGVTAYVVDQTSFAKAWANKNLETVYLNAGNYQLIDSFSADELTIIGLDKENCKVSVSTKLRADNKTLNLSNLTYNTPTGLSYTEHAYGWVHYLKAFNMDNCNVDRVRLNVYSANISNCTFTLETSSGFDGYCIYYYGADKSTVKVSNSTFQTAGKAICLYNESAKVLNFEAEKCTFVSSDSSTDKCAIQMHTEYGINGTVKITECTATNFLDKNNGLWNELNNSTKVHTDLFDIYVDGTQVH